MTETPAEFAILNAMIEAEDEGSNVASAARGAVGHLTLQQYGRIVARLEEAGWIRAMIQQNGGGEYSVVYAEAVLMKGRAAPSQNATPVSGNVVNVVGSVVDVLNLGTIGRVISDSPSTAEPDRAT